MLNKSIIPLAILGGLGFVVVMGYWLNTEEEIIPKENNTTKKVMVKEETYLKEEVLNTQVKKIASIESKSFLTNILEKISMGKLSEISNFDIRTLISFFQNTSDVTSAYNELISLYSSDIEQDAKIFLLSLLGDISTQESTQTLMHLLDLDSQPSSQLTYVGKKAIANLVYDNVDGKVNIEASDALMAYWQNSDTSYYKPDITKAILQIGKPESVEIIVDTLNNTSTSTQDANLIAKAMTAIRGEEATQVLVDKYNAGNNSTQYNKAYLEALRKIANEAAIEALYVWATGLESSEIAQVETSFKSVQQRNPNAENIVKENLYEKTLAFTSPEVKNSIEAIFK